MRYSGKRDGAACHLDPAPSQRRFMDGVQHLADPQAVSHGWVLLSPPVNRGSEVTRQQRGQAQPRLVVRSVLLELGRYRDDIFVPPSPPWLPLPATHGSASQRCRLLPGPLRWNGSVSLEHALISVDLHRSSRLP